MAVAIAASCSRRLCFVFSAVFLQAVFGSLEGPSIFCFLVVKPGDEAHLVAQKFLEGIGIFSCNDYILFSSQQSEDLFAGWKFQWNLPRWPPGGPTVEILESSLNVPNGGQYATPLNVDLYNEVWQKVFNDGRFADYDWTIKLDMDTVFHPQRLKDVLRVHCPPRPGGQCDAQYLLNDGSNLHSPIEAFTKEAVQALSQSGFDACNSELPSNYTNQSEDAYMQQCLQILGVKGIQEPNLLMDFNIHNTVPKVCEANHGSFFPFWDWGGFMSCMGQATIAAPQDQVHVPAQIAWTRDIIARNYLVRPKMFCWTLSQASGDEPDLLKALRFDGLGVFSCDEFLIISNSNSRTIFGNASWDIPVTILDEKLSVPSSFSTDSNGELVSVYLNAGIFIKAWNVVLADGRWRNYDWIIKVDVDLVIVPERLRGVLSRHCMGTDCKPLLLSNWGQDLQGPIEAITRAGLEVFERRHSECEQGGQWKGESESQYFSRCASVLGISSKPEPSLLSDYHRDPNQLRLCDSIHATFHPFKLWADYLYCLRSTGYYYLRAPPTTTLTTTRTETTSTETSMTITSSTATFTTLSTTSVTSTTITTTIPFVIKSSLFYFEGESLAAKLPPSFVGFENLDHGYPLAGVLLLLTLLLFASCAYGLRILLNCGRVVAVPASASESVDPSRQGLLQGQEATPAGDVEVGGTNSAAGPSSAARTP